MGRWLGVDHGHKRIGLAVGDTQARMASPVGMIAADRGDCTQQILSVARDYEVQGLVVGWPINTDGTEGPQAVLARRFAAELAKLTDLPVRIWDERLSSFTADEALKGLLTRKKKRARQDAIAAAAFLQDFLSHDGENTAHKPDDLPWPKD
jgi:putative holliday junction resolvase